MDPGPRHGRRPPLDAPVAAATATPTSGSAPLQVQPHGAVAIVRHGHEGADRGAGHGSGPAERGGVGEAREGACEEGAADGYPDGAPMARFEAGFDAWPVPEAEAAFDAAFSTKD